MTTTGESLYSGLLNRSDVIGEFGRRSKTIQVSIRVGSQWIVSSPVDVSVFRFSAFQIPVSGPDLPVKVFLTFSQNSLFAPSSVVRLSMRWPHSFALFNDKVWVVKFSGIKPKSSIRAQLVPISPGSVAPSGAAPRVIRFSVPNGSVQHVAEVCLAHAAHSMRDNPRRNSSRNLPFSRQPKHLTSPVNLNSTYVSGTEQTGIPWSQTPVTYNSFSRTWTSVNTPNFGRVKRVNLPVNPYTLSLTKTNLGQGLTFRTRRSDKLYVNRAVASTSIIDEIPSAPSFDDKIDGRAVRKLAENAEVDINNIAQDLVQFRQTTNMIASSAIRVARAYTALRHGNFSLAVSSLHNPKGQTYRNRPSHSRDLASNWLELQYGWKPLLQDIDGSMRSLANYMQNSNVDRTVRASAKSEIKSSWPVRWANQPVDFGQSGTPLTILGYGNRISLQVVKYVCRFRIDSRTKAFLSQTGFTSPVNLAWELLPYSFVVDWFLPIGPYLESMSAFEGFRFLDGSKTIFIRNKDIAQLAFSGMLPRTPAWDTRLRALYDQEVVVVQRTKLTSFPSQKFPLFKNPFSVQHALNAVALLTTAFRR